MSTTEPLQGLPMPQSSDAPNGPVQIGALAIATAPKLVMVFASASARTTAFAAAGVSPGDGMLSARQDGGLNKFEYYSATAAAWRVFGSYRDKTQLASAAGSITFSGIPTYLSRIELRLTGRCDSSATATSVQVQIGGDAGTTYRHQVWFSQNQGNGSVGTNHGANSAISQSSALIGYIPGNGTVSTSVFGTVLADVVGWDAPHSGYLTGTSQSGYLESTTNNINSMGNWAYVGSNSYTSIKIFPSSGNFVAGTQATIRGYE